MGTTVDFLCGIMGWMVANYNWTTLRLHQTKPNILSNYKNCKA